MNSLLSGNIYLYLALKTETIQRQTRNSLFTIFSIVSAISLILFVIIAWRFHVEKRRRRFTRIELGKKNAIAGLIQTLKTARQLLKTSHIRLLLILFAYLGKSTM